MNDLRTIATRYRPTDQQLRYVAAVAALVTALIHLYHPKRGFPRLALILTLDNPVQHLLYDPRPLLFTVSGLAIISAVMLVWLGYPSKPIYALGIGLVATYFVGYFVWHLTGHGGFLPGRKPLYHGLHPVVAVIEHLRGYPIARVSKLVEAILLVLLAVLYRSED